MLNSILRTLGVVFIAIGIWPIPSAVAGWGFGSGEACAPAPRAPRPSGITIEPADESYRDTSHHMAVDSPLVHAIVQLQNTGSGDYIWVGAHLDGFMLDSITDGLPPCHGGSSGSRYNLAGTIDTGKGDGQHIYIVVDDGPGRVITELPAMIPVAHGADSGPHTLRAFMNRSWYESLRNTADTTRRWQTDLYCIRTFYIGTNTGTNEVDSTLPLLTLNAPLDTNSATYTADHVLLDFHLAFRTFSDGYALGVTLRDSAQNVLATDTLHQWVPYCIRGLDNPPEGHEAVYVLNVRVLDGGGNPVSNGTRYELNDITRAFTIVHQ